MHNGSFIILHDNKWLERQRIAGKCVASVLKKCNKEITSGTPKLSLKNLEEIALSEMRSFDCTPTFLDYKPKGAAIPFPSAICTSVNEQLVHGIVSDYILKEGDVVSVDLGATYNGAIADAAYTSIYGESKSKQITNMLKTCQESLNKAIDVIKVGKRLGSIGSAIHKHTKDSGFGLITAYGGHGICWNKPHAEPFVANKAQPNEGIRIQPGLTIAIEPMLVLNSNTETFLDKNDNWTIKTKNIGCHYEHTIFIHEENVEIITNVS